MRSRLFTGTLAALSLAGLLASPALADNTAASTPTPPVANHDRAGCPDGFDAGDAAGVRICRGEAGAWRLMTTDPAKSGGHEYAGTLTTDGKFSDVQLIRPESDDSASIDAEGKLNYDFKTFSGVDGVQFQLTDEAREVTFNLFVDGQQVPANHIWIGDEGRHPKSDPFTLRAHHHERTAPPAA